MRFVSLCGPQGQGVAGVLLGDQVADLSHPSCRELLGGTPPSLLAMVEQGLQKWAERLCSVRFDSAALRPRAAVRLLAPLRPGKVVGAACNFTDALAERNMEKIIKTDLA